MKRRYDLVVLGAGPAGLAAAAAVSHQLDVLLVDKAADTRRSILEGVGGAGLYSDGKVSFFPAATRLWHLEPTDRLASAYKWFLSILDQVGMTSCPALPDLSTLLSYRNPSSDAYFKRYPSQYLTPKARQQIIAWLAALTPPVPATVERITLHENELRLQLVSRSRTVHVSADALVLAPGRFVNQLRGILSEDRFWAPGRIELGVRLEQPVDLFGFRDVAELDPKWIWPFTNSIQYRTFCCCRRGKVEVGTFGGTSFLSGRADCEPTRHSNVGFMVRYHLPHGMPRRHSSACYVPGSHTRSMLLTRNLPLPLRFSSVAASVRTLLLGSIDFRYLDSGVRWFEFG